MASRALVTRCSRTCFTAAGIGFDDASVLVRLELHLDAGRKLAPQGIERVANELGEDSGCRSSTWCG